MRIALFDLFDLGFFGQKLLNETPVLELLSSANELNDWQTRSETDEMKAYVDGNEKNGLYNEVLKPFVGKIQINNSGWVDMQKVVQEFRKYFPVLSNAKFTQCETYQTHVALRLRESAIADARHLL